MKPLTTLFLLMSVDGKISTGNTDLMDVDKDFPNVVGLNEGLKQYYDIEQQTDLFSLNTGRVLAKVGVNERTEEPEKLPVSFVVIDNQPHLTEAGVRYLSKKTKDLILVTTNSAHPALFLKEELSNLHILTYENEIDLSDLFQKLYEQFDVDKLTIQSGGTLNTTLIRLGLVDRLLLVVAPALIGGQNTSTLMDGLSLHSAEELSKIKTLELVSATPLEHSYLLLEYKVKN